MIAKRICGGGSSSISASTMEKIASLLPIALVYVLSTFLSECMADSSYFLFQPPYGGGKLQESIAEKRSDSGSEIGSSLNSIQPAETLWIGSHKINWSPLPLLLKFTNPGLYNQQIKPQEQPQAQARKYEPFGVSPTKEPYQFQKPTPPYSQPQYPQQNVGNKFSFPNLANLFAPRPQPPRPPQPQLYQLHPHNSQPKIEPGISNQPGVGYVSSVSISRSDTSTQSPIFVSTSASILVSPPGTVRALSSPGPSIKPIVDRLKKMTQWSQKKQRKISKKEGKIIMGTPMPDNPLERRIRLKKRLNAPAKQHKHNIEAIILANDNEDENFGSASDEQKIIVKQKRSKARSGKTSMSRESIEDRGFPSNSNLVIIHPTNAAYLDEPLVEHSSPKKYEVKRKDKKMAIFKNQDSVKRPAPFTFRFGPEDARPSPYS